MGNRKKYVAIYVSGNQSNQMPSLEYTPRGYMNEAEVSELTSNCEGTAACVNTFDSKESYEAHLEEIDEQWSNDLYNSHHWDGNDH